MSPDKAIAQPAMFADTGFPRLMRALAGLNGEASRLRLDVASGASMPSGADSFKIGDRNLAVVKKYIQANGFMFSGHDVAGTVN